MLKNMPSEQPKDGISHVRLHTFMLQAARVYQQKGYLVYQPFKIPGLKAYLYVRSTRPIFMGFTRVDDHFLFVDADKSMANSLVLLKEIYRCFSAHINQAYKVPHALRLYIPNLALVALTQTEFPEDMLSFARFSTFNPWYGGEAGQLILLNIVKKEVISLLSHSTGRYPVPGAFPLQHASNDIRQVSSQIFLSKE
jgi:hypothetical protein